jgi:RNA polymerase-binding transcription factor DksA
VDSELAIIGLREIESAMQNSLDLINQELGEYFCMENNGDHADKASMSSRKEELCNRRRHLRDRLGEIRANLALLEKGKAVLCPFCGGEVELERISLGYQTHPRCADNNKKDKTRRR